jgi:hypothetical protein
MERVGLLKDLRVLIRYRVLAEVRIDPANAVVFSGHSGEQIRSGFLWREMYLGGIKEKPVAKASLLSAGVHGPEGPCSLRR